MTAQAGIELGFRFSFIAESGEDTCCVDSLGDVLVYQPEMSAEDLFNALNKPDVITVEKEMVNAQLLKALEAIAAVCPNHQAIYLSQHRIREKNFLRHEGIPTANFEIIESQEQLRTLPQRLGYPIYIKAAESGYDGYNQWRIQSEADLEQVTLSDDVALIAEQHVDFSREVSIIAARNAEGATVFYPLMENRHEHGVLLSTIAPASDVNESLQRQAIAYMETILDELNYVGVLTMECFETAQGLVVNELAPRVHNSGHWSIEGCQTSQFENHCRAIANNALGSTGVNGISGIVNMLGKHGKPENFEAANMFYHAYGKQERPRRKLGHITVTANDYSDVKEKLNQALSALYGDEYSPLK